MTKEEKIKWLKNLKKDIEYLRYEVLWHYGHLRNEDLWHYEQALDETIETLKQEPVKHGKWEDTEYINVRKCSCCQAEWGVFSNKYWNSIEDFNYCPNCGAKMDKENKQ